MKDKKTSKPVEPSAEGLFRFQVISQVKALKQQGELQQDAVKSVADKIHFYEADKARKVSERTLYRWLRAFEEKGFQGLIPAVRGPKDGSAVISDELLAFFKQEKEEDPVAGIPELIRRAKQRKLIDHESEIDRTTLWRCLKRMGVDTSCQKHRVRDKRRFSYPHRMDMVLCDGKHFRAGLNKLKRVALFFLDDSTRYGLNVVVGTSESAELFLRGLYETLLHYGMMRSFYTDHGSGFIADDCVSVMQQLDILFVQGEVGYKEGRGKIERFNRTALDQCLRYLKGNHGVNPDCDALELRIRHYLSQQYNQALHEGIGGQTPSERFHTDSSALTFKKDREELQQAFVLHEKRYVFNDNVVSFEGVKYEMPKGYAKTNVVLHRHLLENKLSFIHQGNAIVLHPVDLHANAVEPRCTINYKKESSIDFPSIPPTGSAQIAFNNEYGPIVDIDGGFSKIPPKKNVKKEKK